MGDVTTAQPSLDSSIRSGLTWSAVSSLLLRVGTLAVGIVLARLLTPEEFGTFAVALTVQALVMSLSDLGLATQLIRSRDFEREAPTVASVGALSGLALSLVVVATAPVIARGMGSVEATSAIAVLGMTMALGGIGVVPFAHLQREFGQGRLLLVTLGDFLVGTTISIVLVLMDHGALGLAWGRFFGQLTGTCLLFVIARRRPRFGWSREQTIEAARFGIPIAGANVLSWATLGLATPVIAHEAGMVALGFYVLAFNVSSWPMTVLGTMIRAVALPTFSRTIDLDQSEVLERGLRLTWAVVAPCGVALAVLADPVIRTLYGDRWATAAGVLAALGVFGSIRVVFDMLASFLLAHGSARWILLIQLSWLVTLVPALFLGVRWGGIVGAALAQVVVVLLVSIPLYAWRLHQLGIDIARLGRSLSSATVASAAAGGAGWLTASVVPDPPGALVAGGLAGLAVYYVLAGRRLLVEAGVR